MKAVIVFFLVFAIVGVAEEKPATQEKRLTSVTWDVQTRKLAWVVQTGQAGKDGFYLLRRNITRSLPMKR